MGASHPYGLILFDFRVVIEPIAQTPPESECFNGQARLDVFSRTQRRLERTHRTVALSMHYPNMAIGQMAAKIIAESKHLCQHIECLYPEAVANLYFQTWMMFDRTSC